jgi:hypothetical protein
MALDTGAQGIVVPYVETVAEVERIVGAVIGPSKESSWPTFWRIGGNQRRKPKDFSSNSTAIIL